MSGPLNEQANRASHEERWTARLILFLRVMAGVSMLKGLYHWSVVVGIGDPTGTAFETSSSALQSATIFFAVIDLVAAVGLWLVAAWGGVVWLTAAISMVSVELFFPQVFGAQFSVVLLELVVVLIYLGLAVMSARERPA
ncbi:MAG TPA: DUF6163 family protein [Xanthobacteraceae bacterium]|nr:DUF6163 family protein [Xanthobacteraceae bacterium]